VVATAHLAYFLFIIAGFIGIMVGARVGWAWIYNPWFRGAHLFAVLLVLAEDVFRFPCALNVIEGDLRRAPLAIFTEQDAISKVLDLLLRHTIPGWFLDGMYWTLGVVLLLLIFILPPRFPRRAGSSAQ